MAKETIGRAFLEVGANVAPLIKAIDQATGALSKGEKETSAAGFRMSRSFEAALNPAAGLEKRLTDLGRAGYSAGQIVQVYGARIQQATDVSLKHGQTLSPIMANYRQLATEIGTATTRTTELGTGMARSTDQLQDAQKASMLLSRAIGVQLPEAVTGFLAKSTGLSALLSTAFKASVWATIGIAIWESGKKLLEWSNNAKEAKEKAKELTDEIKAQLETFERYASAIDSSKRKGALIGLNQRSSLESQVGFTRDDLDRAKVVLSDIQGQYNRLYVQSQQYVIVGGRREPTEAALRASKKIVEVQDQMREAENRVAVAVQEVANAERSLDAFRRDNSIKTLEKQLELIRGMKTEAEAWKSIVQGAAGIFWENADIANTRGMLGDAKSNSPFREVAQIRDFEIELNAGEWPTQLFSEGDEQRKAWVKDQLFKANQIGDLLKGKAKEVQSEWSKQISSIVTDWSRGMADMIVSTHGFTERLKSMMADTAKAILRFFLEQWLKPLEAKLVGIFGKPVAGTSTGGGAYYQNSLGQWAPSGGSGGGGASSNIAGGAGYASMGTGFANIPAFGTASQGGGSFAKFANSEAGAAVAAGMVAGGSMMMSDAWKRGGVKGMIEGASGGAMAGFAIAGPWGAAIGAGVGFAVGLFGGGEKRRQEERDRRARVQSGYAFDLGVASNRSGVFGMEGEADAETDITGRVRGFGRTPIIVNLNVDAMDEESIIRRSEFIGKAVSRSIMTGGGQLSDDVAWAAG